MKFLMLRVAIWMRRTNFSVQKYGTVIQLTKEEARHLKEYLESKL
jgi:hypothetical protein